MQSLLKENRMQEAENIISQFNNDLNVAIKGLGIGEQAYILANLNKPIVFLAANAETALKMYEQLCALGLKAVLIDNFDKIFLSSRFSSKENFNNLLNALYQIAFGKVQIVVATFEALLLKLCDKSTFVKLCMEFKTAKNYNFTNVINQLTQNGYSKVQNIEQVGDFAVRGDIIDINPPNHQKPIRLSFFGDELEQAYYFDIFNNSKNEELKTFGIAPYKIWSASENEKNEIIKQFNKLAADYNQSAFYDLAGKVQTNAMPGAEFLQILNVNKTVNFLDFCEDFAVCLSSSLSVENAVKQETENINKRINIIFDNAEVQKRYMANYLPDIKEQLKNRHVLIFDNTENFKNYFIDDFFDIKTIRFNNFLYKIELLVAETLTYAKTKSIILCLENENTLNAIANIFTKMRVKFSYDENQTGIVLTKNKYPYNICFENSSKLFIGSTNFAHKKAVKYHKASEQAYLPKTGEYVVHVIHGIGQCVGIVTIKTAGIEKDFFKLKYKHDEYLYVPVENTDSLSLYVSGNKTVALNKLGGREFAAVKQRAQKAIDDMAQELINLYSIRNSRKGHKYQPDDYLYTEFENAFAFEETPDQTQAIADVKNDMQSDKIMDRLICGDVGYGKTEVAIRAMFKAVLEGKQVAVLAPTTILSMQHYMSIIDRLKNFEVNVEMLNRFKTKKEQTKIIEGLKNGKVSIVCGTHRLLSKDVNFANLGLLVLDEEQRFGVKAKERIKQLKNDIDVLALSATPIPRTLNMALLSLRDISIINTPPKDRLAVKTYVLAFNIDIVAQAIKDETARGGQVLVVFNDIEKIYTLSYNLKKAIKDDSIIFDVAHGQMPETVLENTIKRLYDRQTQVLVSTTLIENGIDLPKANTLIVLNSHKLGLSQMYQLRGRVGRSNEQAYAYFTYPREAVLTPEASSRLEAIAEHTELGSGFKIAMRDLQLRGAGELLGREQHGHLVKIGYELYIKLLNEATGKLRGEQVMQVREIKIDIELNTKIPFDFASEEVDRIKIYSHLSNISDEQSQKETLENLKNVYGKLPPEVVQLSNIALIKAYGTKQNIKHIKIAKDEMFVVYYDLDFNLNLLLKKLEKFDKFVLKNSAMPTISLDMRSFSVLTAQTYLINFLKWQNF